VIVNAGRRHATRLVPTSRPRLPDLITLHHLHPAAAAHRATYSILDANARRGTSGGEEQQQVPPRSREQRDAIGGGPRLGWTAESAHLLHPKSNFRPARSKRKAGKFAHRGRRNWWTGPFELGIEGMMAMPQRQRSSPQASVPGNGPILPARPKPGVQWAHGRESVMQNGDRGGQDLGCVGGRGRDCEAGAVLKCVRGCRTAAARPTIPSQWSLRRSCPWPNALGPHNTLLALRMKGGMLTGRTRRSRFRLFCAGWYGVRLGQCFRVWTLPSIGPVSTGA